MNGADRATGRRPRTPSAQVTSELLNAAESVLVEVGMRGLTVRAVAAGAGVAPMSVYDQFGGKEADARARLVSVNVKHGRPRPAKGGDASIACDAPGPQPRNDAWRGPVEGV